MKKAAAEFYNAFKFRAISREEGLYTCFKCKCNFKLYGVSCGHECQQCSEASTIDGLSKCSICKLDVNV